MSRQKNALFIAVLRWQDLTNDNHIIRRTWLHGLCCSDVPSQWEGRNFDSPQLPHFSTDLNETWNQEKCPQNLVDV